MMDFTNKRLITRGIHNQARGGIFIRVILYISVICVLNTLFFAIVKFPSQPQQSLLEKKSIHYNSSFGHKTIKLKFAKSLLRLLLDNYLAEAPNSSDTKESTSEEVHKIEYISHHYICQFQLPLLSEHAGKPYSQISLKNPVIDGFTPPPKAIV